VKFFHLLRHLPYFQKEICPGPDYENPDHDMQKILQPPQLDSTRLEIRKKLASG